MKAIEMNVKRESKTAPFHSERGKSIESLTNQISKSMDTKYFKLVLVIYTCDRYKLKAKILTRSCWSFI